MLLIVNSIIDGRLNLSEVAQGLVQSKSERLCLYGPPGTGKTAFARWLAKQLKAPLVVKRTSDIMSKWVGENEKISPALSKNQIKRAPPYWLTKLTVFCVLGANVSSDVMLFSRRAYL